MRSSPCRRDLPTRRTPLASAGVSPEPSARATLVRALVASTYLPTFLAEIGVGAILPLLTLSLLDFGSPATVASLGVGLYSLGRLIASPFVGALVERLGSTRASMAALGLLGVGALACAAAPGVLPFLAGAVVFGAGHAAVHVSRQAQVDDLVADHQRARALTTLAGLWRVANFVGPLLGAAVIVAVGLSWTYVMSAGFIAAGMVALRLAPAWRRRHYRHAPEHRVGLAEVVRHTAPTLRTLGIAVVLTGALRQLRNVVIPLWGAHLGLDDHTISVIFSISAAVDMVLFVPAGYVMDRWGRKWTAVPSSLLLAAGTVMLLGTSDAVGLAIAGMVLGLGNGWGSGVLMTLAGDVAPARGRAMFIGLWMALQDAGGLLGPVLLSVGTAIAFPLGFGAAGVVGVATAGAMMRWIPPWRLRETPAAGPSA